MIVRPIRALEISVFAERAAGLDRGFAPEGPQAFQTWLDTLWVDGRSSPELCFVAETDMATCASAVFWRHADMAHLEHLRGADNACVELLDYALPVLQAQGIRRVWVEAVTPPTSQERVDEVGRMCERASLNALAQGIRFEIDVQDAIAYERSDLAFHSFDELGRGAFIDAMARCTPETLDPQIARDFAELGNRGDAQQRIDRLLELDGERAWWEAAYSADGDLAGMVLPTHPGGHVIGFVGVVPHWRGRGVAQRLVRRATATLIAAGASRVRADVSSANLPMMHALKRSGFRPFATRHVWERTLSS